MRLPSSRRRRTGNGPFGAAALGLLKRRLLPVGAEAALADELLARVLAQRADEGPHAPDLGVDGLLGLALALADLAQGADDPELADLARQGEEVLTGSGLAAFHRRTR